LANRLGDLGALADQALNLLIEVINFLADFFQVSHWLSVT